MKKRKLNCINTLNRKNKNNQNKNSVKDIKKNSINKKKKIKVWSCQTCGIVLPYKGMYCCCCGTAVEQQNIYTVVPIYSCLNLCKNKVICYAQDAFLNTLPLRPGKNWKINYKCRCCSEPLLVGSTALACALCNLAICSKCVKNMMPKKIWDMFQNKPEKTHKKIFIGKLDSDFWNNKWIQKLPRRIVCPLGTGCRTGFRIYKINS